MKIGEMPCIICPYEVMNMNPSAVNLTEEEAHKFRWFLDHYATIQFMIDTQVFDIKQGNAILSFDAAGRLKTVKRELFTYKT